MITHSRIRSLATAVLLLTAVTDAHAQFSSTRRMGMGGVQLLHGGPGSDAVNVAYRAVPEDPRNGMHSFSLPVGVIPVLQDPPSFDPNDSSFSAYELANLVLHPPWNIALKQPEEPTGDITIDLSRNSLSVDLGGLRTVVPSERIRMAGSWRGPAFVFGVRRAFVGVAPLVDARNDIEVGDALRSALRDGAPFQSNTSYDFSDHALAQAAGQVMVGARRSADASAGHQEGVGDAAIGLHQPHLLGIGVDDHPSSDARAGRQRQHVVARGHPHHTQRSQRAREAVERVDGDREPLALQAGSPEPQVERAGAVVRQTHLRSPRGVAESHDRRARRHGRTGDVEPAGSRHRVGGQFDGNRRRRGFGTHHGRSRQQRTGASAQRCNEPPHAHPADVTSGRSPRRGPAA